MSEETLREPTNADATIREDANGEAVHEGALTEREPAETRASRGEQTEREARYRFEEAATYREDDATRRETGATFRESDATAIEGVTAPEGGSVTAFEGGGTRREEGSSPSSSSSATLHEAIDAEPSSRAVGPRVNLPAAVARDYEWVRDLDVASGEADVCIIRNRETGVERFFKRYHRGLHPDEDVLVTLQALGDRSHIVEIVDYSSDSEDAWEIQEYCPLGTIGKGAWREANRPPYKPEMIRRILEETSSAIHHIHHIDKGVSHRDIKPSNILIRAEDPLDLVLTDFGIARDDQAVTHRTTFAGTNLYAAPEAHGGESSMQSDWFALGAIVYELLTARKLLANKGSADATAKEAEVNCLERRYYDNVESIPDERWRMLVKGLVVDDRNYRWGYSQIERWLNGESPEVYWVRIRGGYAGMSPEQCYQPPWSKELLATPEQLAESIGEHWGEAKRGLAGRETSRIKDFLRNFPGSDRAIAVLNSREPNDKKLVHLQLMLNPKGVPRFAGRSLEGSSVKAAVSRAEDGDEAVRVWLLNLVRCEALVLYGEYNGDGKTAAAGHKLKKWYDQAKAVESTAPDAKKHLVGEALKSALSELFSLAYKD